MRCLIRSRGATRHSIFFADVSRTADLACLGAAPTGTAKPPSATYYPLPVPTSCPLAPKTPHVVCLPNGIHASLAGPQLSGRAVSLPILDLLKGLRFGLGPGSRTIWPEFMDEYWPSCSKLSLAQLVAMPENLECVSDPGVSEVCYWRMMTGASAGMVLDAVSQTG